MENKSEYSLKINLYWIYLIGVFLIIAQIINVIPPWFTPTDWGKAIIFRIILSILIFLFLFQILFRKINFSEIKEKIKSVSLPFYLLVSLFGIYLLSTIFSLDPHFSLWGDPRRNGGFVNFAFYIIFAILTFLIIHKKDWQKIWDFTIIIGIIVSIVAIFQQFGLYSKYLIPFSIRPISTLGNAILLSLYLLLLTFISLSFGLKAENRLKKIFYFTSVLLFLSVSIISVQTRGAFLGLAMGFLWFLFAYPNKNLNRKKIYAGIILLLVILGAYSLKTYLDSHLYLYQKMPPIFSTSLDRVLSIFEGGKVAESRISTWAVSWRALKDRPILGYGPENFLVAFDKYYDPSLPRIGADISSLEIVEWWDRAHNFVFDISITAGIPTLIIYLSLFGVLIWQLQKVKYANSPPSSSLRSDFGNANGHMRIYSQDAVISNGVQATFIGYLVALFFSFDSVSTYLVSFLLIGYSLHLISDYYPNLQIKSESTNKKPEVISHKLYKYRVPIILVAFIFLIIFIQIYNIKPFQLNKETNIATLLSENKKCQDALGMVSKISPQIKDNIIDNYLNHKLSLVIYGCLKEEQIRNESLIRQAIQILKEPAKSHSNYLQNWFLLGEWTNILIEEKNKLTDNVYIPTEEMEKLKEEANYYFEKAHSLSPKRQIILKEWAKTDLITGEYEKAKEKLKECLNLNPDYALGVWVMALAQGYSGNSEEFQYFFNLAKERGYNTEVGESLKQLVNMYIKTNDYKGLAEVYPKLINITEDKNKKAQLYASLAVVYKELGQIKKARETALKALELLPEAKDIVDEFLKSLE